MIRHFEAYLIVFTLYYFPIFISYPTNSMYFVAIAAWAFISGKIYLRIVRLRCATILAKLEIGVMACAMIALAQYRFQTGGLFYDHIERIVDGVVIIEVLVITSSLVSVAVGILGASRYNKDSRRPNPHRAIPF